MDPKFCVVKSKSSNSTITNRPVRRTNKKTRSNATFERNVIKKRGMYVEKKNTEAEIQYKENKEIPSPLKNVSPTRPHKKNFLNSVLKILSQSTIGTQLPSNTLDNTENLTKSRPKTSKAKSLHKAKKNNDTTEDSNPPKYKSKVLNSEANRPRNNIQPLTVLQPKKYITQTPSSYSERSNIELVDSCKWIGSIKPKGDEAKQITEGRRNKSKIRFWDTEHLVTQVNIDDAKPDRGLYDLFVDLLQSTISDHKMKTNFSDNDHSISNVNFEIDETVANRLSFKENDDVDVINSPSYHSEIEQSSKPYFHIMEKEYKTILDLKLANITKSQSDRSNKRRRKRFAESFIFTRKPVDMSSRSYSFTKGKPKTTKKTNKGSLLGLLRQELKISANNYVGPQSLFEALQLMAKYKKQCQRRINFAPQVERTRESDPDCVFKRRRVMSTKTNSKKQLTKVIRNDQRTPSDFSLGDFSKIDLSANDEYQEESVHSLEVYEFDYQ